MARPSPRSDSDAASADTASADQVRHHTVRLLEQVLPPGRRFDVRLWDGSALPAPGGPAAAALVLTAPESLGQMLQVPVDLAVGEAFVRGDFDIEGDALAVFEAVEEVAPRFSALQWAAIVQDAAALRRRAGLGGPLAAALRGSTLRGAKHSRARDQAAVQYHYDVSNAFYQLWLDRRMVYSCGYFPTGTETLDQAQTAKLDLICRKLRLKPGERLLDIGSGWGGLALYAAQHHGVEVLGVTLSARQLDEARARAEAQGLAGQVRFELQDYRDVSGQFDKISSVGMAEHVGHAQLGAYFQTAWDRLRPGGLMLNHAISRGPVPLRAAPSAASGEFVQRYIFPDSEILPLWQTLKRAEQVGFEVRDVEDLREHYGETLRRWLAGLETHWDAAEAEVGRGRLRLWRLYLAGCAHQFAWGHLAIHQALLAKPAEHGRVELPASRADLYS